MGEAMTESEQLQLLNNRRHLLALARGRIGYLYEKLGKNRNDDPYDVLKIITAEMDILSFEIDKLLTDD